MNAGTAIRRIAFVGTYLPRKCGIATFTHDLRDAVSARNPDTECFVVAASDIPEGYDDAEEGRFELVEEDREPSERGADVLTLSDIEVVCLQHEYELFGGPAGNHILAL